MHKNKKRKHPLRERLARFAEIPQDAISDIPVFVMRGRGELEVEGCSGILEYGRSCVVLSLGRHGCFTVEGERLELGGFGEALLYIRGEISSLSFGEDINV